MYNKIYVVDLSTNKVSEIKPDDGMIENYLGGRGLAAKLFTDRVKPGTGSLDTENVIVVASGPVTGTAVPTSGRIALVTKSPLTNTIFYSNTGGKFGAAMKRCGCDGFIIEGAADKPKYIVIDGDGGVSIKDAGLLWGLDTEETLEKIRELEGRQSHSLMIGPAGENLVYLASIMNDAERAFGRGGVGAVMGSKRLKAVVVKNGKKRTGVNNPELLKKFVNAALDKMKALPITNSALPKFGTAGLVNVINHLGMLPVRNFQEGQSDEAHKVSGEAISEQLLQRTESCYNCTIKCGRMTRAGDMTGKGPEYETVWALGPSCGVFDLIPVTQANYFCNKLGMDTISTGATIACAMELQEKGLLSDNEIRFGNADILVPLVKKIAAKEGIGAELCEGSRLLSRRYKSEETSMQVKGLELPAYDPRGAMGHALGYATSNRGGCHLTGYLAAMEIFAAPKKINPSTTFGKPDLLVLKQHQNAIEDSLVICKFVSYALGFDFQARFVSAVTGIDIDITGLLNIGERIYNLERIFNLGAGITGADDTLPQRFLDTPLKKGFSKDQTVPLEEMLKTYYKIRQWDEKGVPTEEKLKQLGLL